MAMVGELLAIGASYGLIAQILTTGDTQTQYLVMTFRIQKKTGAVSLAQEDASGHGSESTHSFPAWTGRQLQSENGAKSLPAHQA
jgi:hypothetical protein